MIALLNRLVMPLAMLIFSTGAIAGLLDGISGKSALLDPSEAFKSSVTLQTPDKLSVSIDVAPGYYLYKSRLAVESEPKGLVGTPNLPDGIKKTDQFFGEVETYRGALSFLVPITGGSVEPVTISLRSQGCADIGVCYPPEVAKFVVEIPAVAETGTAAGTGVTQSNASLLPNLIANAGSNSAASSSNSSFGKLTNLSSLSANQRDVLAPEEAFRLSIDGLKDGQVKVNWQIEPGHYLYHHKFDFELVDQPKLQLTNVDIGAGIPTTDESFGEVEVHRQQTTATLHLTGVPNGDTATLIVHYQGCADIGICYPPTQTAIDIPITASALAALSNAAEFPPVVVAQTTTTEVAQTAAPAPAVKAQQDQLTDQLTHGNSWLALATFFFLGLLLTFTPCVLPMVPILSSIIVGDGEKTGTSRAFLLSLIYVLAMAVTYTIAGIIVGLGGDNVQATLQHPYVIGVTVVLFILLSLSMFGLYELQLPQSLQNRLTSFSGSQSGGKFTGVAVMGVLSALIVGPCITAPLVGILIYIAQSGDAVFGGAALFSLSMGMGLPLLLIGTSFGRLLPKAGKWMDSVKVIFGLLLLGMAIWMLDRIAPGWLVMFLAGFLLIISGTLFHYWQSSESRHPGLSVIAKGTGYTFIVYGTLLIIGMASGSGSMIQPLAGLVAGTNSTSTAQANPVFEYIRSVGELETRLAQASQQNQPVILDFYADWCVSCKEMEAFTFTDPTVAGLMKRATLLKVDVTRNTDEDKELLAEFGIFGPPATIFYNRDGKEQSNSRVIGFMKAETFAQVLENSLF